MLTSKQFVTVYLSPQFDDVELAAFEREYSLLARELGPDFDAFWVYLMHAEVSPRSFLKLLDIFTSLYFLRRQHDIPGKIMSTILTFSPPDYTYLERKIDSVIELISKVYTEHFVLIEQLLDANKTDAYNIIDMLVGWEQLGAESTQIIWQLIDQYGFAQTGWMLAWQGSGRGIIERKNGNGYVLVMTHNQLDVAQQEI